MSESKEVPGGGRSSPLAELDLPQPAGTISGIGSKAALIGAVVAAVTRNGGVSGLLSRSSHSSQTADDALDRVSHQLGMNQSAVGGLIAELLPQVINSTSSANERPREPNASSTLATKLLRDE